MERDMPVMGGPSGTFCKFMNYHIAFAPPCAGSSKDDACRYANLFPELILAYLVAGAQHSVVEVAVAAGMYGYLLADEKQKQMVGRNTYVEWRSKYFESVRPIKASFEQASSNEGEYGDLSSLLEQETN
jgi:hypothetical protein